MFLSLLHGLACVGAGILVCTLPAFPAGSDTAAISTDSLHAATAKTQKSDSPGSDHSATGRLSRDTAAVVVLDKMVVSANRRQKLLETSQSLAVIKPEEWAGTAMSVADIIAGQPGVQTRRYGGMGSFQTVSIRGVQGSEVLVLLDGIPLNSAMGGAVDLGAINSDRLGEIEVYKGIIPGEFGGNSIGGVINLKSKTAAASGLNASAGAYGLLKCGMEAGHPVNDKIRLYGAFDYKSSDNNWPYLDRNKTPYSDEDDVIRTVENHAHEYVGARLHGSADVPGGRTASTGISYSKSSTGIPALEGSVNRTAVHRQELFDITARLNLDEKPDDAGVFFSPIIGFLRQSEEVYWTGLDESMGTSHGGITSAPDSWGEAKSDLDIFNLSCVADILLSEYVGSQISLHGKYSAISSETHASGFPHGNWPGNSQEATLAIDVNGSFPMGAVYIGANAGGSIKAIRSATDGGRNDVFEMTVLPSDTIEYPWAAHGGIQCRMVDVFNVFVNAGRYSNTPSLSEKYGGKGAVVPNPALQAENTLTVEAGARLLRKRFWFETAVYRTEIRNGIVMLSDGSMTKPVNLAAGLTEGFEATCWIQPAKLFSFEGRMTLQNAVNHSRFNNYYGKKLPGEPEFSARFKLSAGPFWRVTPEYWQDYRSFFYRDFGNTLRVPDVEDTYGMVFHNARLVWKPGHHLDVAVSIMNFTGTTLRHEAMARSIESGYSWILYPVNEWCATIQYSF